MKVKKLHPAAVMPAYAHIGDAGMELYSIETVTLNPGERAVIRTGLAFAFPPNTARGAGGFGSTGL